MRKLKLTFAIMVATLKCHNCLFMHITRRLNKMIKLYDEYDYTTTAYDGG